MRFFAVNKFSKDWNYENKKEIENVSIVTRKPEVSYSAIGNRQSAM